MPSEILSGISLMLGGSGVYFLISGILAGVFLCLFLMAFIEVYKSSQDKIPLSL